MKKLRLSASGLRFSQVWQAEAATFQGGGNCHFAAGSVPLRRQERVDEAFVDSLALSLATFAFPVSDWSGQAFARWRRRHFL